MTDPPAWGPVRIRARGSSSRQQRAPCHPEVREREQRHQMRPVLRQAPVSRLHVTELPLDDPERVLDLRADRGLGPFRHRLGRPRRQQATPARWMATIQATPRYPEVPVDNRLVTVQQGTRHHEIVHVGRRRHHHVDQPGVRVDTDVRLHAEEPLVPLAGLVHLRVPRARPVLCRARGRDDRRIDQRAPADHQATRPEHRVDLLEQGHGQVVAPGEVAEAQDGRGVRDAGGAWVDARKRPLHRDIVQSLTGRLVGEREPLLQEVDPQQHQDRVRWPAGGPRRGERDNPGD